MSEQFSGGSGGKGGFGPKKPKATFGDVMLGIPSGQGGREDRGRPGPRREGPKDGSPRQARGEHNRPSREKKPKEERAPRPERPLRPENLPSLASLVPGDGTSPEVPANSKVEREGNAHGGRHNGRFERKGREKKRHEGPMVVIRRVTGAIETRVPGETPAEHPHEEAEAKAPDAVEPVGSEPLPSRPEYKPNDELFREVPEEKSFAELYEDSAKKEGAPRRSFRVGEKVQGKIFQLGPDTAFVSLGGRSEAMIELGELTDAEGILRFGVGDEIEAHVVEVGAKGIILSKTLSKGAASFALLSEARVSGMPVEGLVLAVKKGGFDVAVGEVKAFCPIGQFDLRFVDKPERFVGESFKFRVTEVRERNVVLSRRALLEEEQKALAAETRKVLAQGKVMTGKVTSVRDFGAFVDLGGLEGLIPTAELSHLHVGHPSAIVKPGDTVEVEVLKLEAAQPESPDKAKHKERITLSMRSRQEDPWKAVVAEIHEGDRVKGKVVRLQPFGAFVELRPGVDGLIHVSALSRRRIAHPKDVVSVGQEVEVLVEKIDETERRIGLRLYTEEAAKEVVAKPVEGDSGSVLEAPPKPKEGQIVTGVVDRIEPYGVFLKFPGGRGLIPASETGTERGTDLKKHFRMDQELTATILEIDRNQKIRLSLTAAERAEERAEMAKWTRSQKVAPGKGFGTFADLLKDKKLI